ncbi:hypothetical protein [Halapricum salinum]|nr:hypothetical protein [Halapricum salinum]
MDRRGRWAVLTGAAAMLLFGLMGLLVGFVRGLFVLLSTPTAYVEAEARIEELEERVETLESELDVHPTSEADSE